MDWFHKIFRKPAKPADVDATLPGQLHPTPPLPNLAEGQAYLEKVRGKVDALAERFISGKINRQQFQELYAHYQSEIQTIEQALQINPDSNEWKNAVAEGQSIIIRRRNATHLVGYSIYANESGLPLLTAGDFKIDPALFVPMLDSYRSATREIFGADLRSTQIEGGRWLCFVPGQKTTTLALCSTEPSPEQLRTLEQAHRLFEQSNENRLVKFPVNPENLVCPHDYFLKHSL